MRSKRNLVALLLAALVLWTIGSVRKSLWGDEFHSLHHIRAGDWPAFFEAVRSDNHPPLSFLLERVSARLLGESELALRAPSILAGLLALFFVERLARALPERTSRRVAPWFALLSSYLFAISTEARMYALLALCVLGLLASALDWLRGSGSRWWVTLWVALGLHAHYYFLHDLFVLGLCTGVAALAWPRFRPRAAELLLPAALGGLLFLPWAVQGFFPQLFHELPPGGHLHGLAAWAESLAHLAYWNASLGGGFVSYGVALPGALIVAFLGATGAWELARRRHARPLLLFLMSIGIVAPLWSLCASLLLERASYGWPYIAGSAVPVLLLVAAGVSGSPARLVAGASALGTMLAVTLVGAVWGGAEDYRGAVRFVLASAEPGDGVVAKPLWDPDPERSPTGWDYYLERLQPAPVGAPAVIPFAELGLARHHPRVWVLVRDAHSPWVLATLRRRFERERTWRMGTRLELHLFSDPLRPPGGAG